jgi:hypothetical protein
MKMCGGVNVYAPPFLISTQDGSEWSASRPGRFTPRNNRRRYQSDGRLGGPQSRFGRCGVKTNLLPLLGIEPLLSSL